MDKMNQKMHESSNNKKSKFHKPQKRVIAFVGALIVLAVLSLFSTGFAQYGLAYIKCGKAPISGTNFAASFTYQIPGDPGYHIGIFQVYYCTEDEATRAGLRHYVDPTSL